MKPLGEFFCVNLSCAEDDSGMTTKCELGLSCPDIVGGECERFYPDGHVVVWNAVELWLTKLHNDGASQASLDEFTDAVHQALR